MWDLWWTKRQWGRFSFQVTSVSLAKHSTDCSTLIIVIINHHLELLQ
jgi:cellulose synthase/poly-beta-1,6-N-acetylglucosamine synthase-like glycosyltransferase